MGTGLEKGVPIGSPRVGTRRRGRTNLGRSRGDDPVSGGRGIAEEKVSRKWSNSCRRGEDL